MITSKTKINDEIELVTYTTPSNQNRICIVNRPNDNIVIIARNYSMEQWNDLPALKEINSVIYENSNNSPIEKCSNN